MTSNSLESTAYDENGEIVVASPVGSQGTITKMLEFAARHNIEPTTEHFSMNRVNDALDHLRAGKAHYRIVLDA